ncbi:MAG: SAM-dependent methyltransferase [Marmoricola sp.]|nr:SAM-dependent methyltransferase [Marmoricola sp.]
MIRELWDQHLLPRAIDVILSDKTTGEWREQVCVQASGDVLEVGFGSGTNLSHYPDAVRRVLAVEPADVAWQRASRPISAFGRPVERIGLDGARIDVPDASVDTVVSAYTMCTIPDLDAALVEFSRVLRPGGRLHFLEHSLSPEPAVAAKQRSWQPRWEKVAGGCHLDRDIPELVRGSRSTVSRRSRCPGRPSCGRWAG